MEAVSFAVTPTIDTRRPDYQALKARVHQELISALDLSRLTHAAQQEIEPEIRSVIQMIVAREAITQSVVPSYRQLKTYFDEEYLPASFPQVGAWQWPDGAEAYAFFARRYTTTDLTPQQIHEKGLSEVARIRAEMQKVMTAVGDKGTHKEFFKKLRTGDEFYYKKP